MKPSEALKEIANRVYPTDTNPDLELNRAIGILIEDKCYLLARVKRLTAALERVTKSVPVNTIEPDYLIEAKKVLESDDETD